MTADQVPTYRPTAVTQRDGSELANSNCRMASIATGIDYHSGGTVTSTGRRMRTYTTDQAGGTDSADAREAWAKGYDQYLRVRDGGTWADVIADLEAGRLVHLDVWHATVGGPCLSGSGLYGHTMAILPDCSDGAWLVADPWCKPAHWARVAEARLQAGAERFGAQVYARARREPDWPTSGPIDYRDPAIRVIVARVVKRLMTAAYPGHTAELGEVETAGPAPVLYTVTMARPLVGDDDMARFVSCSGYAVGSGKRLKIAAGTDWYYLDGTRGGDIGTASTVVALGLVDAASAEWAVLITTGNPYDDKQARPTIAYVKGGILADAPPDDDTELEGRRAQWDADALNLIGPRP